MSKRILSVILLICMLVNNLPVAALAEEAQSLCGHVCDESCGFVAASGEVACDKGCLPEEEGGEIVHGADCAYNAGSPCNHKHNGQCGVACTHAYAEGICAICGEPEPQPQPCAHTGGTATCTAQAVCDTCSEGYGELADHTGGDATCTVQAVCTVCETAYGELADHTYSQGICSICGAVCEHTYAEEFCTVCGMAEPVLEPQCNCGVKCNKEFQDDECPVCSAGTYEACVGNEIFAYSMNSVEWEESNSKMQYLIGTYWRAGKTYPTIDVQGKAGSNSILTTYGENGYLLQHNLPDGVSVSQDAAFVNDGYYVKLFYTVKNNTANTVNGHLGICADVQIGNNDNALVEVIYRENTSRIIGLSMKDAPNNLQFNLFFDDAPGASGTNRYWIGQYNGAGYINCWDDVSTITQSQSSWDSAIAVSWDVNLDAGETKIYSVIVGVGEIADPPQWDTTNPVSLTMAAEATQGDWLLHVAAKVKDAAGVDDKLYYNVDNGTNVQLGDSVTGDGQTAQEIKGIIDLTNLDNGPHTFRFWIVNEKGAISETVQRVITITDGAVTGDHITFIEHSYTVNTRQSNGGAVSSNHTNVLPGAEIALTAIPDTGYRFDKFVVTDSAGVEITVTDNKFTMPASDVTVRAIFSPIVYSITVTTSPSNGGTVTGNGEYEANTSVTVTATAASGYRFTGWIEDGEVVSTDASYTFTATGARNLVANFELIPHTVTFYANGGSGNMDPLTLDKAVEQALTKNAFTRNGYTFAGWATTANGQADYTDQQVITVQKDTDLYAVWTLNQYTITYDLAGGSGVENGTYTVESETFTLGTPQKTGYTFIGWITEDGEEPQTDIQITKGSTGNKTYTACWLLTGATVKAGGYIGIYDGEAHEIRVQATHELVDKTLSYQWYKDGKEDTNKITGATAATWSVTNVADSGTYYCEVGISDGDIAVADWSDAITVTIYRAPVTFTVKDNMVEAGKPVNPTVVSDPANVDFTVTYCQNGKEVTPAAVGEYDIYVAIEDSNYRHANSTDGSPVKVGVLSIYEKEVPKTYTLTYVNGNTTVTEDAALAGTVRTIRKPDTTPTDDEGNKMLFVGWVQGNAVYQPGEKFLQAEENVTLTAKWEAEKYTINGIVKQTSSHSAGQTPVEGATVTLKLGSTIVATTTTDAEGKYTFPDCLQGTYNLIAEYEGVRQTIKVVLNNGNQERQIILPAGKTNTVVSVLPGTPAVVVGGMDDMMTKVDEKVFTEADQKEVEAGGEVEIKMEIKENSAPAKKEQIDKKIDDALNASSTVELYIDMDLTKTVKDANGSIVDKEAITESNVLLENIVHLPGHLQGKDNYHVFRHHKNDDGTEVIEALPLLSAPNDSEGFVVSSDKTAITIYSSKYSTFAIVTSEKLTVTFDPNGGTVNPAQKTTNEFSKIDILPEPVRTGYEFLGWYTQKTGGTKITESYVFETDTTVYAQWKPINYKITIVQTDNGTVYTDAAIATVGTAVKVTVSPKSGYRMSTLTVKDEKGNSYSLGAVNDNAYLFSMPAADVAVTATFVAVNTAVADTTNPKTGDDFRMVLWTGTMLLSSLGILMLLAENKKKQFVK